MPTNYTISTYKKLGIIEPLDLASCRITTSLAKKTRASPPKARSTARSMPLPKNWGTTGFAVNTKKLKDNPTTLEGILDLAQAEDDGRAMVHDYQLTTIGNALKYYGYPSTRSKQDELAKAEKLLLKVKPHLFAINSDYQPAMRNGDAWLGMCWTNDGAQLHRDMPEIAYVLGKEGGEIWTDFYAIPKGAPNRAAGYALLNYPADPAINDEGVHRQWHAVDRRAGATSCCPRRSRRPDPLSGGRPPDAAGVRRGGDVDQPGPRRADGALQVGLSDDATACGSRGSGDWTAILLLAPAAAVFLVLSWCCRSSSCWSSASASGRRSGGYQAAFTLAQYANLPARWTAFWNTLMLAPIGTLICLLVAYPLAYYPRVAGANPRTRLLLLILVIVPFWTSLLMRTYAWMYILGGKGIPALLANGRHRRCPADQHARSRCWSASSMAICR